jgi:putative SOS response-associated peptidase YedK
VCGRYAASAGAEEVVEAFAVDADLTGGGLRPTWNAAPTQRRAAVVARPRTEPDDAGPDDTEPDDTEPDGAGGGGVGAGAGAPGGPRRELRLLTWGLVPSWSKDRSGGARMINARAETVLERPAYRRAAAARRCLVPADGWYEWQRLDGDGAPRKQPYFMSLADGGPLALAGIYEHWRPRRPAGGEGGAGQDGGREGGGEDAERLTTFAVLTRDAEPGLSAVHERMPLVLPPEHWAAWLDPELRRPEEVDGVLGAAMAVPPGRFTAVPVAARVGSVRSDDPELVVPVGPPLPT